MKPGGAQLPPLPPPPPFIDAPWKVKDCISLYRLKQNRDTVKIKRNFEKPKIERKANLKSWPAH